MAIYDCFQYFNEDHMVDLRLNILNSKVDYFVISESTKNHQGKDKKLNFNINNFQKYKNKIKYVVADYSEKINFSKHTGGESLIEKHQRNSIVNGLKQANDNDLVLISDSDEIPDLNKLNLIKKNTKFTVFSQKMFMYKLNLQNLNESNWMGSRAVLKKNLTTPQEIRDLKFKKYSFWRIDKIGLQIINAGWHFSFLQKPSDIAKKIKSYSHGEFNKEEFVDEEKIAEKIFKNEDIFGRGYDLKKIEIDQSFPSYVVNNKKILNEWIL